MSKAIEEIIGGQREIKNNLENNCYNQEQLKILHNGLMSMHVVLEKIFNENIKLAESQMEIYKK